MLAAVVGTSGGITDQSFSAFQHLPG